MIEGRCECGGVRWTYDGDPRVLTACSCGFGRRAGALWAYGSDLDIRVEGERVAYLRGDRTLAFNHCPTCGAVTHWGPILPQGHEGHGRRAVSRRLADPTVTVRLPVKRFGGTDTWRSLAPGEQAAAPFLWR